MSAAPGEQRRWISSGQGFIGPEPPNDGRRWIEVIEVDSAESQLVALREERDAAYDRGLRHERESARTELARLQGELEDTKERLEGFWRTSDSAGWVRGRRVDSPRPDYEFLTAEQFVDRAERAEEVLRGLHAAVEALRSHLCEPHDRFGVGCRAEARVLRASDAAHDYFTEKESNG